MGERIECDGAGLGEGCMGRGSGIVYIFIRRLVSGGGSTRGLLWRPRGAGVRRVYGVAGGSRLLHSDRVLLVTRVRAGVRVGRCVSGNTRPHMSVHLAAGTPPA